MRGRLVLLLWRQSTAHKQRRFWVRRQRVSCLDRTAHLPARRKKPAASTALLRRRQQVVFPKDVVSEGPSRPTVFPRSSCDATMPMVRRLVNASPLCIVNACCQKRFGNVATKRKTPFKSRVTRWLCVRSALQSVLQSASQSASHSASAAELQSVLQSALQSALEGSAPGLSRTGDQRFRKPLLYPLSYGGERDSCARFLSKPARKTPHLVTRHASDWQEPPFHSRRIDSVRPSEIAFSFDMQRHHKQESAHADGR